MKKILFSIMLLLVTVLSAYQPYFMHDPAISVDGETICFTYDNDLWLADFDGGNARRITDSSYSESGAIFSPDGKYIAFNANRGTGQAIYIIPVDGGKAKKICQTSFAAVEWFSDSKHILAVRSATSKRDNLYKVSLDNKQPVEICGMGSFYSSLSVDNKEIIFTRRGKPFRESYTGSTNGELWIYNIEQKKFRRMTNTELTERYPKPSYLREGYYFAASDGKNFQLNFADKDDFTKREILTSFKDWSVRDIDVARVNDRIIFEYFDKLCTYDPQTKKTNILNIEINEDSFKPNLVWENVKNQVNDYAVSTDGKFIAFNYKYDLFVMPEDGGTVKQITFDQKFIEDIEIINDDIFFIKYDDGESNLYTVNIQNLEEIKKIKTKDIYVDWLEQSQNQLIIYYSDGEERDRLLVYDPETKKINKAFSNENFIYNFVISHDKSQVAYTITNKQNWTRKLFIANINNKEKHQLYFTESYINAIGWSIDGNSLLFSKSGDIYRADLKPTSDFAYKKNNWNDILNNKNILVSEDTKNYENMENRIKKIIMKDGYNSVVQVKKDSTFFFMNDLNNTATLWKTDFNGKDPKKISTISKNAKNLQYHKKSKKVYFIQNNQLKKLQENKIESINLDFSYEYNIHELNKSVFYEVWTEFGRNFYDKDMHNVDWTNLKYKYGKYLDSTISIDDISSIVSEMVGEVNASHTGFYPRNDKHLPYMDFAYLGCTFDYSKVLKKGITVKDVYRNSKLYQPFGIRKGDILLEINGTKITPSTSIKQLVRNSTNRKIEMKFKSGKIEKYAEIIGLTYKASTKMQYDSWVYERSNIVENVSNGKIGYLHIRKMDDASLKKFYHDLYTTNADKEGLIIDVRYNGGGRIHDQLIEALSKKTYAKSIRRGVEELYNKPSRAFDKPVVVLINEDSFSDAEIFPHLFKELNLGKVIGMPTSGSVIGTTPYSLNDGSSMRMPVSGWFINNRINMEGNGVKPDIQIEPTPEQLINDDDIQLKKGIEVINKLINQQRN